MDSLFSPTRATVKQCKFLRFIWKVSQYFSACGPNTRTIHEEHNSNDVSVASQTLKADKLEDETAENWNKRIWRTKYMKTGYFVVNLGCQESFSKILLRNNNGHGERATKEFRLYREN